MHEYLQDLLERFKPAAFHLLLPTFRWCGLATTNFDLVIEQAYELQPQRAQRLVTLISNRDRIDERMRVLESVCLIKLHGCITRTGPDDAPLILTPEQYIDHRKGRARLYDALKGWGYEHSLVFVGQSMEDMDLRAILMDLATLGEARPRYYLVSPHLSPEELKFWDAKQITAIPGTFEEFLRELDAAILPAARKLRLPEKIEHPIQERFAVADLSISESTFLFLTADADYVHSRMAVRAIEPKDFYRGVESDWSGIAQALDVRRILVGLLLSDIFSIDDADRPTRADLYVIKAEAGAGKSICLRRTAWEAAQREGKLCIYVRPGGRLQYEAVAEIARSTKERVFLFVDDASEHVEQLEEMIVRARRGGTQLTVISAERTNEWNMHCERLDGLVSRVYRLPYLEPSEIETLVDLLERYDSLGVLQSEARAVRIEAFERRAGRQLLVALHEATQGRRFSDILVDEFKEIEPQAARSLYLSVCVLNRLGVSVRAGLISRLHGIPFSRFRDELFRPLQHVVLVSEDPIIHDYTYTARHPLIAEMVRVSQG